MLMLLHRLHASAVAPVGAHVAAAPACLGAALLYCFASGGYSNLFSVQLLARNSMFRRPKKPPSVLDEAYSLRLRIVGSGHFFAYPDEYDAPYVIMADADINIAKVKNHQFYLFNDCMVRRLVWELYDNVINYILHHCQARGNPAQRNLTSLPLGYRVLAGLSCTPSACYDQPSAIALNLAQAAALEAIWETRNTARDDISLFTADRASFAAIGVICAASARVCRLR